MIHERIDHIPCCQVHPDHLYGSDYSCQVVQIQAFPSHNGKIFIVAVVTVPIYYLLAILEVATVFIVAGYNLEVRIGTQRCNQASERRLLEFNQCIERTSAGERSAVINDSPGIRRCK